MITEENKQKSFEVIKQRFAIGGYRLADYLLRVFKDYDVNLFDKFKGSPKLRNRKIKYIRMQKFI